MKLTDLVTPKTVIRDIRGHTKPEVLAELAGRAANLTLLDRMTVFRALLDSEASAPTGLGMGVALPHARFKTLVEPFALFAKLGRPIEYHALDNRPVDLLILLLGPEPATAAYLKLLRSAARTLRDPVARDAFRADFEAPFILATLQHNVVSASF